MQTEKNSAKTAFLILGALMLLIGAGLFLLLYGGGRAEENPAYFDSYSGGEEARVLAFNALSDPFASPSADDSLGIYFAMDFSSDGGYLYLVCLSQEQFGSYQAIYEETFSDSDHYADYGTVTGYPAEITPELREYAIEYFNDYFLGTQLLTEENFSEYVGDYYLDAARRPGEGMRFLAAVIGALAFLALAVYFFVLAFSKPRGPIPGQPSAAPLPEGSPSEEAPRSGGDPEF